MQEEEAIRKFNHGMHGVDRFDLLVSLFSLAKQHSFRKYYNKLTMGLLDFALVNAELHYFMANKEAKANKIISMSSGMIFATC